MNDQINFDAFSHGQILSKIWLCEQIELLPIANTTITILGGWLNVLGFMLSVRRPNYYKLITNVDLDETAITVADKICNAWSLDTPTIVNVVGDGNLQCLTSDVVINCSVEHFKNNDWFAKLPQGTIVVIQSSDMTIAEYPWLIAQPNPTMESFLSKFPVVTQFYAGTKHFDYGDFTYNRFMLIGKV